jgi:hypothetical protein
VSNPKGCQGYGANDGFEVAIFILALSLKLLLTAEVTAHLLFFASHRCYRVLPGPAHRSLLHNAVLDLATIVLATYS